MHVIRNPLGWGWDQCKSTAHAVGSMGRGVRGAHEARYAARPTVCRIHAADLKDVLARGIADFGAYRTDVIFLCLIYPIAGLVLSRLVFGYEMLPMLFPLFSGFALIGPVAAVGLYEMSRRRERGEQISWVDAFSVVRSPSFGAILGLGLILGMIFLLWLVAADAIYRATLGPQPPESLAQFMRDVLTTPEGWRLIAIGSGVVGFLFAVLVLSISVVSFPLLLDRDVGLLTAVWTSLRVVAKNPGPMALWGLIVAASLVVGSLPLLLGLIVVMPVLGHATWHLYRKTVAPL